MSRTPPQGSPTRARPLSPVTSIAQSFDQSPKSMVGGFIVGALWALVVVSLLSNPLSALQKRAGGGGIVSVLGGRRGLMEGTHGAALNAMLNAGSSSSSIPPGLEPADADESADSELDADAEEDAGGSMGDVAARGGAAMATMAAATAADAGEADGEEGGDSGESFSASGSGSASAEGSGFVDSAGGTQGTDGPAGAGASSSTAELPPLQIPNPELPTTRRLRTPWEPMLTAEEVKRGLAYYGSGKRLEAVAAKLMAGRPIKIFTLGGSVTKGQGSSAPEQAYPAKFFEFITTNFPHKDHQLINKGVGATSSGIFAACAEQMVAEDADLIIVELTINEHPEEEYTGKQRQGYEQLLRKLLKIKSHPAVLQVHHYAWWRAEGDGAAAGLFYFPAAEAQLTVMSQYYDIPALSLRSAIFPLLQAGVPGFKADKVWNVNQQTMSGAPIPVAELEERGDYFYYDRSHPNDGGHRVLAELIASLVMRSVEREESVSCSPTRWAERRELSETNVLPPPMVPGNADAPTTLCAMQEDFKGMVAASSGFEYRAERPQETTFVGQKWGWTADKPGSWAELEFDTRQDASKGAGHGNWASVYLSHLKSYVGMGTARVSCVSGCHCAKSVMDGTWEQQATLMQIHGFKVTQHARCRVRVTVSKKPGVVPQEGHKVTLMAIMVSHYPLRMDTFDRTAEEVAASVTSGPGQA